MKTDKRISDTIEGLLQNQIKEEMFSSNIYLHMGNWCNNQGYFIAGSFFHKHAEEERIHMKAMISYLNDRNCMPNTPSLENMEDNYSSLEDVLRKAYEHEKVITEKLNKIYEQGLTDKDFVSVQFIGKYVHEQIEEESLFNDLLITMELADGNVAAILMVEQKMQ